MPYNKKQSGLGLGGPLNNLTTGAGSLYLTKALGGIEFYQWQHAEVIEIQLNPDRPENVGKLKFRTFNDSGKDSETLSWAFPLIPYLRAYPVLHEIVAVTEFNGIYYWLSPLNTLNLLNNNIQVNLTDASVEDSGPGNVNKYKESQSYGIPKSSDDNDTSPGETFKNQRLKIGILSPKEGDVIFEGRFANSIRLGNNPESNLPNIKISVRDLLEDFSMDSENLNEDSCIFITTDEILTFNPVGIPISEANSPPFEYNGKQIMITSDRLIFNAKLNEVLMFSNRSISFASNDNFSVDTDKQVMIRASQEAKIEALKIMLGNWEADEPLVLGNEWKTMMLTLIDVVLTHIHPSGTGPTGPIFGKEMNDTTNVKNSVINNEQLSDDNFTTKKNK